MKERVIQFRGTVYEQGYGLIAQKAMRDKDLTPIAKAIYAYLCSFASEGEDGERTSFPGVSLMIKELGIGSKNTYYKHRELLLKKGYITIEKQKQEKNKFYNNLYYIEAVPVEVIKEEKEETKETPSNQGKDHVPNIETRDRVPTDGIRKIETRKNWDTNSNSLLSLRGLKEEEEKEESTPPTGNENELSERNKFLVSETMKYLSEMGIDNSNLKATFNKLHLLELDYISMRDVIKQYNFMNTSEDSYYDFTSYFVGGLEKRANKNKTYAIHSLKQEEILKENQKISEQAKELYYDWLNED